MVSPASAGLFRLSIRKPNDFRTVPACGQRRATGLLATAFTTDNLGQQLQKPDPLSLGDVADLLGADDLATLLGYAECPHFRGGIALDLEGPFVELRELRAAHLITTAPVSAIS